jgi:lipopolysaccharide export system permease protein
MLRIERYLFRTATSAFLAGLLTLTAVIWVTQALKQLDLMTSKGQTILVFLTVTGLGLPFLTAVIAPVALFASVLYCLNKLNGDSELVVMSASGISTARLLFPFLALFALVFLGVAALYIEIMPRSFQAIQTLTARVHADFIANFARPGAFTELEAGFVFHYRERANDGSLRGVFIQDRRDATAISTYIAEVGEIVEKEGETYLLLLKGSTQRPRASGDSAIITFDDYAIDLSQFIGKGDAIRRPRERTTWQLFAGDSRDPGQAQLAVQWRAELLDRFTSPFYAFAAGLIGFAALGEARTTRQGRGLAIISAVLVFAAVRLFGITVSLLMRGKAGASPPLWVPITVWAIPLVACAVSLDTIFGGPLTRGLQMVRLAAASAAARR